MSFILSSQEHPQTPHNYVSPHHPDRSFYSDPPGGVFFPHISGVQVPDPEAFSAGLSMLFFLLEPHVLYHVPAVPVWYDTSPAAHGHILCAFVPKGHFYTDAYRSVP